MREISEINLNVHRQILGGAKVPHCTSQPVIYKENDAYYMAYFVFFYTREDIDREMANRPTLWVIADMKTGQIVEQRETYEHEFSDAAYDRKYSLKPNKENTPEGRYQSPLYYNEAYAILETVRNSIITVKTVNELEYQMYMDKILAYTPKEYQRFYKDLSI